MKVRYVFISVFLIILFLMVPKANAVSYLSDYVELEETVEFESDEFFMDFEYTVFSNGTPEKPSAITGHAFRKTNQMYYYHYVVYYYNLDKMEIGATDGYNGIWDTIYTGKTGSYCSSFLEQSNMYGDNKLTDIVYYRFFVEPSTQDIAHAYLYDEHKKINSKGIDPINDLDTVAMQVKLITDEKQYAKNDIKNVYQNPDQKNEVYQNNDYQNDDYQNDNYEDTIYQDEVYENEDYQDSIYQYNNYIKTKLDYTIDKYNVSMVVNEDNTYDITENITVNFNRPISTICKYIPVRKSYSKDGNEHSRHRVEVTDINVNKDFEVTKDNELYMIEIGKEGESLRGEVHYEITYKYNPNSDKLDYDLINYAWGTVINNFSFSIKMPKSFKSDQISITTSWLNTGEENIEYNVDGNLITGIYNGELENGNLLRIKGDLDDGYFKISKKQVESYDLLMLITVGCLLIAKSIMDKVELTDEISNKSAVHIGELILISLLTLTMVPSIKYGNKEEVVMTLVLTLFYIPFYAVIFVNSIPKEFRVMWGAFTVLHSGAFFGFGTPLRFAFIDNQIYILFFIIGILSILTMISYLKRILEKLSISIM